jgi:hypothetical protein
MPNASGAPATTFVCSALARVARRVSVAEELKEISFDA